jgi:hypothetical protein
MCVYVLGRFLHDGDSSKFVEANPLVTDGRTDFCLLFYGTGYLFTLAPWILRAKIQNHVIPRPFLRRAPIFGCLSTSNNNNITT